MSAQKRIDWDEVKSRVATIQATFEQSLRSVDATRLEQVYRDRARQFATRSQGTAGTPTGRPALTFTVGAQRLCLDLGRLVEVLAYARCAPLPGARPELLGVVNVRGRICSVLDLARILELPPGAEHVPGYIVLARHAGVEVGLKVDNVEQIETIAPNALDDSAGDLVALSTHYIRARTAEQTAILDIEAVFSHFVFNSGLEAEASPGRQGRERATGLTQFQPSSLPGDVTL